MFEILLTGISTLLVIDIVGLVITKLKSNQSKYQASTEEFEIRLDPTEGIVFLIATTFFGFCAIGAYKASIENGHSMWLTFAIISFICAILTFMFFTNVKIKRNNIIYKKYLLPKIIHCTFSEISHYSTFADKITLYYKNKKKAFSIDKDMIGSSILIERLNKENIICSEDGINKRTIKKKDIIYRNGNLISGIIVLTIIGLIIGMSFILESYYRGKILEGVLVTIFFIVMMDVTIIVGMLFIIVPEINNIKKIEKGLGINFDKEMEKEGVTSFFFKNEIWYIDNFEVIINRNYIESIEKIVRHSGSIEYHLPDYFIYHLKTIDGKIMKIKSADDYSIKNWLEKKN